jgi:hypothetical protein
VKEWTYWEERVSMEDLDDMWRHPEVKREWTQSNEKKGQVRFACDAELQPYLTTTELKVIGTSFAFHKQLCCADLSIVQLWIINAISNDLILCRLLLRSLLQGILQTGA